MNFCTITPSRGDRPELLEFCRYQLSRMEVKPDKFYFIDYKPSSEKIDLVERIKKGVELAKADGFDTVFIVEDDDYYPADYFKNFNRWDYAFWGSEQTTYYNLRSKTYSYFQHTGRSSLFTTGFKISALDGFAWYAPKGRFLDISLWEFADNRSLPKQLIESSTAVGIKHNLGLCAGKGHTMMGKYQDDGMDWLSQHVDKEAFEFYSDLMKKLQ